MRELEPYEAYIVGEHSGCLIRVDLRGMSNEFLSQLHADALTHKDFDLANKIDRIRRTRHRKRS